VIVHKEPHLYSSHPCITALHNGEWLVAFNQSAARAPFLHPPADPHYINLVIRSVDRGRTWSDPQMAPGFSWYGMENPGIAQLDNGDVLLNQFKFDWLPRDLAHVRWKEGTSGIFVCPDAGAGRHKWFSARSQADWDSHAFPYARTDGGAFVQISLDNGHIWTHTVPLDIAPYQGAFSPKGALQLASGDVLLALGSHEHDPLHAAFVVRSTDYGRTWKAPAEVARLDGCEFCEPSITQTTTGRVICMLRDERSGFVYQSHSDNEGESWSPVRRLDLWGYPPHAITLTDGRLLVIYGHRRPPYGIYAALSDDDGASWSTPFLVRDLPNANLGYPSVIEYEPGRLFTVYYGEDTDQVTCLHGTYVDLDVPDATTSGRSSAHPSVSRERVD
jgi:sialidase-1